MLKFTKSNKNKFPMRNRAIFTRFLRETFALICLFAIIFTSTASISARTRTITPTNYGNQYGFTAFSFAFGDLFNPIINFFGVGTNQIAADENQRSRRLPASPSTESDTEINESARMPDPPTISSAVPCTPTGVTLNVPGSYATIQTALNAANPLGGDAIQVSAGTYTEQLVITKCVSIIGAGEASTFIQSPAALAPTTIPGIPNIYSIVEARSGAYVNMSDLTVQGPVPFYTTAGPFASSTYGIFVAENATLEMDNARVTAIHKPSGIDGVQNGNAVQAGRMAYNQIGSLDFDNVTIDTYQKTGVLVDRTGSSAIIANSTISGIGPTAVIGMNGIQVSRGASATITDSTISGHEYTPNTVSSTGILPFNSTNVTATGNTFNGNDVGIYHFTSPAPMSLSALNISTNTFTNNPDAGIIFDAVTPTITDNFISGSNWGIGAFPVNGQTIQTSRNSISAPVGANSVGIYVDDYDTGSPTTTATINANFTRITGHTAGIQNDSGSAVNAVNNFWGCNTGPGGVGCDTVAGTGLGLVTFNPWLVLNNTTSSLPSVNTGGMATVTTNLRFNSAMVDTYTPTTRLPNAILSSPNGIPVNFSSNAFGSVSPTSAPLFNGQAQTTFTGGGVFSGDQTAVVTVAVDNATDSVNIIVEDTTVPTVTIEQAAGQPDPANAVPVNFTAVFSEAVTGFTNADISTAGSTATIPGGNITVTEIAPMNGTTYTVAVTPTTSGFVTVSIPANAAIDPASNGNAASTSTDNTVSYFVGTIELIVDDDGMASAMDCNAVTPSYNTINGAVAAASAGYIIRVCPGTYPLASTVNVALANLTIVAAQATKPIVQVGGTMDGFNVTATGVTLEDLEIVKIGTGDQHHMVRVLANNFTGKDNYIHGPSWQMPNHVSRAFIIAPGVTGFLIDANVIEDLRQPAYTDPGTSGTVSNNTWTGTKGWVNDGGLITFTNNTMTTCAACDTDIALLNNADPAYQTFYANRLALSNGNNNAHIDVQFTPAADSGRAISYVNKATGLSTNDGRVTTPYQSIQQAIFNPTSGIVDGTLPGGTVNVAAGTYIENIDVSRQLSVLGPNEAINPNTGSRVAEAVITTAVSDNDFTDGEDDNTSTVVRLNAEGIIFRGFTVDGDNPLLTSGYTYNGADLNAFEGIVGTGTNNPNLTITNNIVKNMGEFGIDVWGDQNTTQAIPNLSTITDNKVDNVVGYFFGWGIFMGNNAPGTMTGNVVTRSFGGLYLHHFNGQPASRPASTVSGNNVSVYGFGVWFNLHYAYSGTPNGGFTVSGNTINSYTQAPENGQFANQVSAEKSKALSTKAPTRFAEMGDNVAPFGWDRWIGVRVESINGLVPVTFSNNTIAPNRAALVTDGYTVIDGFRITNPSTTTALIDITGNTINGAKRGIAHTAANAVPEVSCNNITNNEIGIYIGNGVDYDNNPESAISGILANNNNLLGNSLFGVQADSGTSAVNNAQMNYWGAADGPGPIGPGTGDKVSANVDFTNFLIAPTNCTPVAPPPTVTINQAMAQNDPTNMSPINFTVVFSESVTGFGDAPADVVLSGTAGATTAVVTGSGTTYNVAVSGMTTNGTVIAMVAPGAATGANGANVASSSTDNTVTYDTISPTVTINQAGGQNDPTNMSPINFTVVFNEPTTNFITGDVTLGGTAGATTATVTEIAPMDGTTYNVAVSGMTMNGTVIASIAANAATDTAGNGNVASTSTDNTVTYDATNPTPTVEGVTDPDSTSPVDFTVDFGETVTGFTASDVTVTGSAFTGTPTVVVTGGMQVYNVAVSGMNQTGNVVVTIAANSVLDASNNPNNASIAGTPNGNDVQFNVTNTTVLVTPVDTMTWAFFQETAGVASGSLVTGPATPPLGTGSARLTVDTAAGMAFGRAGYSGTKLSDITRLSYSSYQTSGAPSVAIAFQFDVDSDLSDGNTGYQGRLVYEPSNDPANTINSGAWQTWDALSPTAKFWGSGSGASRPFSVACPQTAPCTKAFILANFPNIGVRNGPSGTSGVILFKIGAGVSPAFDGNIDNLVLGVNSVNTTFNFESTPPNVSISDATAVTEGDSGTTTANFTVSLDAVSTLPTTVQVSTANGSATTADNDYASVVNQVVTIPAGMTSAPFTVNVNGDNLVETDETFTVNLSNAANAAIGDGQGTGTITNDDAFGTLQFSAATYSVTEGTPNASITITRTGGNDQAVSVNCSTVAGGTATGGGVDYTTVTNQLISFADQDSANKTCSIPITNDMIFELAETVNLSLSNAVGAAIGLQSTAVLTINDSGNFILISGNIQQYNAPSPNTNLAGVTVTLSGSASGTTVTDASGNYVFNGGLPSGTNNYLVVPSLAGKVFDPTNRSYVNLTSNVTNANFVAYNVGAVPRNVRVVNTSQATYTSNVTVPIVIDSLGTENALSFSLNYNSALLDYSSIACGTDAPGCSVSVNDVTGMLGVEFTRADDMMSNPTAFAAGNGKQVVLVTFTTTPGAAFSTPVTFGDSPALRDVNDVDGNSVPTNYVNGIVVFAQGVEGDVAGRMTGSGGAMPLGSNDVTVLRQFVSGAITPDPTFNEFQRADVAPAGSKGGGSLTSADVTVLRNYIAGSIYTPVGGPTAPMGMLFDAEELTKSNKRLTETMVIAPGDVSVVSKNSSAGSTVSVPIRLESNGNENGVTVSLQFEPTKLTFTGAVPGAAMVGQPNTTFDTNVTQLASGRVAIFLTLNVGQTFPAGTREIIIVNFNVAPNAPIGLTPISFVNNPLNNETNDTNGDVLSVFPNNFIAGNVNVLGPLSSNVSVAGQVTKADGAGINNAVVTITGQNGVTRTMRTTTFGNYRFEELEAGQTYTITVNSKRFAFKQPSRIVTLNENLDGFDFVSIE